MRVHARARGGLCLLLHDHARSLENLSPEPSGRILALVAALTQAGRQAGEWDYTYNLREDHRQGAGTTKVLHSRVGSGGSWVGAWAGGWCACPSPDPAGIC